MTRDEMIEVVQHAIGCTRIGGERVVDALVAAGCVPPDDLTQAARAMIDAWEWTIDHNDDTVVEHAAARLREALAFAAAPDGQDRP